MADLSLEDLCIHEGTDYKTSSGARGEQLNIRECAKCGNDNWKVYANLAESIGNCFSCGEKFNLWKWTKWLLEGRGGIVDNRAVHVYLDAVRKSMGYRPKAKVHVKPAAAVSAPFALPTSSPLPYEDGWNHPYLLERGIDGRYAKMFHLHWSSFGSNVYTGDDGTPQNQSFANRIIIPVFDLEGVMVTYQGRDVTGTSPVRYKFAGGLPGTGRYLFNGHTAWASRSICGLLSEGPFDVIGSQKAIDTASDLSHITPLGSFGMHLSQQRDGVDQFSAFRALRNRGMEEVILMWDGELKAFLKALDAALLLGTIGLRTKIACLPAGQDPGGADARVITDAIRNAIPITRMSVLKLRMKNPYVAA